MWCTPASSYPEKIGAAPRDSFLLPDEGLTSAKKTDNSIFFAVLEIGEIKVRPPYFYFSGCSQGQSKKFYSFINTGVGGINSLSDLHLEVCKYRMHRLSHSLNNYFVGRSTRCSYPTGLMNANWKNSLSFRSVGDPFLWLENDYLLLMGRDLSLGFDAPQWRSPE